MMNLYSYFSNSVYNFLMVNAKTVKTVKTMIMTALARAAVLLDTQKVLSTTTATIRNKTRKEKVFFSRETE